MIKLEDKIRELTIEEKLKVDRDIQELFSFCLEQKIKNTIFNKRLANLQVKVSNNMIPGKKGEVDHRTQTIFITSSDLIDDFKRKLVLYHELGHLLFDYDLLSSDEKDSILNLITKSNKGANPYLVITGFRMIEEYLNEKFGVWATYGLLNKDIVVHKNLKPKFGGEFIYDTTFGSIYGIVETICDDLLDKVYSSVRDILNDCLNNDFYIGLFSKFDNQDLISILERLGLIYNMLIENMKNPEYKNPELTDKALRLLVHSVGKIRVKSNVKVERQVLQ